MTTTMIPAPPLRGNPDVSPAAARQVHTDFLGGVIYANVLIAVERLFGGMDLGPSAILFVENYIKRMSPRDPVEESLAVQLILTHARVLHLTHMATRAKEAAAVHSLNEAADRATAAHRRLALDFARYRRAAEGGDGFPCVSIAQANIAEQQVIQQGVATGIRTGIGDETNRDSPKRSYRLSASGLKALRENARRVRPWEKATGPRTEAGKRVSSQNALKRGDARHPIE